MNVNRRGEEIVEAAVVLPLMILTIVSMITVAVLLFRYETAQSEAHVLLACETAGSELIFGIKRKQVSISGGAKGLFAGTIDREKTCRMYAIRQSEAILLGELLE